LANDFNSVYHIGYNSPKGTAPQQKPLPNARLISTTVHPDLFHPDKTITNMVPQVGQFLDHDFALTISDGKN
jgi:peroxidase